MKKLILSLIVIVAGYTANAQEHEKKKDSQAPTRGQERAINESGVSVKTEPKKKSSAKAAPTATSAPEEKKSEKQKKDAKKPE
jgi:hypothetical protein